MDVGISEGSEGLEEEGTSMGMASSSLSSSSSSLSSSGEEEADASSARKEGRLDFGGADLRRGAGGCLVDFAGRGGLKEGGLRFGAGLEVVGGIFGSMRLRDKRDGGVEGVLVV